MAKIGKTAIVVGRSMAGLAAGAALVPHFDEVVLLDRDPRAIGLDPRSGVGQGHHAHNLLKGGEVSIERLLPGTTAALIAAGAVQFAQAAETRLYDHGHWLPKRDLGFENLAATRWLMEQVVRERLLQEPGMRIANEVSLKDTVVGGSGVEGVAVSTGDGSIEHLAADLVVDCTGRGSQLPKLLATHQLEAPPEQVINMGISYTSAIFEAPGDALDGDKTLIVLPLPPHKRGAFVNQVEGGRWLVSLHTRFEKELPATAEEMRGFATEIEVPDVADFLEKARPATEVRSYRKPRAVWRRFDKVTSFPDGLLALGDSIASFNPVYGQGMSVAWLQACALRDLLDRRTSTSAGVSGLAGEFFPEAMTIAREAWNSSTLVDAAYEEVTGDTPRGAEMGLALLRAVRLLVQDDPGLHADYIGVSQMTTPSAALRTPERMSRIAAAASS